MAAIGTLAVNIVARTDKFSRGMMQSQKHMTKFGNATAKVTGMVTKFAGTIAGAAGIYGLTRSLSDAADRMDKLAKTSSKLGIGAQELAGLQFAAEQTGVGIATMDMALQRMVRRVNEAAHGTGEAKGALAELGLSAQRLTRMAPDQQFRAIADAMRLVDGQGERVRLAMKLFDSEGVALVNTLAEGSSGLDKFQKQSEQLFGSLTPEKLSRIEQLNDSMNSLSKAWQGISNEILINIAPQATAAIEALQEALEWSRNNATGKATSKIGKTAREQTKDGLSGRIWGSIFGASAGRELAGRLYDQAAGDNALRRKGINPVFSPADDPLRAARQMRASQQREALKLANPQLMSRLDKILEFRRAIPDMASQGLQGVGRGLAMGQTELKRVSGIATDTAASSFMSMFERGQQFAERQASIQQMEERLQQMGGMAGSQLTRGSLTLTRAGSVESYRQQRRIENQKNQEGNKAERESVKLLKKINEKMSGGTTLIPSNVA